MATTATKKTKKQTEQVLGAVVGLKPQKVIEEIGALQSNLQGVLAGLSAQISTKIEQMDTVDQAIQLKQAELTELYGIESEAMSLEQMRAQCEEEQADWDKRTIDLQAQWDADEDERSKRWQREEEEHAYEINQKRKRAQEDFNVEIAARARAEAIRIEDLQKSWKLREDALTAQEKEVAALKAAVAGFDATLKTEVGKAEAIAVNRMKKEYEHECAMLKKDIEAERALNLTKISALDDTIEGLDGQIASLQQQLTAARQDAKEVTSQALQSASGRQAMEALQRVTDGQPSASKSK